MTWRWIVSLALPLLLFVVGSVVKKLVRGTGWRCRDFFFGVELGLANLSAGMLQLCDYLKVGSTPGDEMRNAAVFTALAFVAFLVVMSVHQDHETDADGKEIDPSKKQKWLLLGFSNVIGMVMFLTFLIWVKGI